MEDLGVYIHFMLLIKLALVLHSFSKSYKVIVVTHVCGESLAVLVVYHEVQIRIIQGFYCAKPGSDLCATNPRIAALRSTQKKIVDNHAQSTDHDMGAAF